LAFESAATIVEVNIAVHAMFMASRRSAESAANARFRRTPIFMGCCAAPAWPM
jgi:hypothetical protein